MEKFMNEECVARARSEGKDKFDLTGREGAGVYLAIRAFYVGER